MMLYYLYYAIHAVLQCTSFLQHKVPWRPFPVSTHKSILFLQIPAEDLKMIPWFV